MISNEVDSDSQVTVSARSTDSVEIGLRVLWEVEVYHDVDGGNVDTTSEQI